MPDPLTERRGVNAVEAVFLNDFKWIFREQQVSDFGIDAQAEVVEFSRPTGKLMALQIKTATSYFRKHGEDFIFYGDQGHLDYWLGHSMPVLSELLVLADFHRNPMSRIPASYDAWMWVGRAIGQWIRHQVICGRLLLAVVIGKDFGGRK